MHLADQGTDAGKRINGRRRHLGCDTLGLLLTVLITAASVLDTAAGVIPLSRIAAAHPHITKAWVDAGYRTTAIDHGELASASTSTPSNARPAPAGSRSSRDGGPSNAASAGSCTTDASPATTRHTRTAPKPIDLAVTDIMARPQTHWRSHPQLARNLTRDQTQHRTKRSVKGRG